MGLLISGMEMHGRICCVAIFGYADMITLICNSKSVLSHFGSMFWIVFEYLDSISLREFFYLE